MRRVTPPSGLHGNRVSLLHLLTTLISEMLSQVTPASIVLLVVGYRGCLHLDHPIVPSGSSGR